MRFKKTYKSALPKSTSTSQQYCNFTTNCRQVSAEAKVKKNEGVNNYTNHDPRMNRISSIVLVECNGPEKSPF
jgi:hypothetical protein